MELKLMVVVFVLIFQSLKGLILPLLGSIWENRWMESIVEILATTMITVTVAIDVPHHHLIVVVDTPVLDHIAHVSFKYN